MKFLLSLTVLSLFLVSQVGMAKISCGFCKGLSQITTNSLRSGPIFKLGTSSPTDRTTKTLSQISEISLSLREINNASELVKKQARNIVATEHGDHKLYYFDQMLKAQEVADILGVDLDINSVPVALLASQRDIKVLVRSR